MAVIFLDKMWQKVSQKQAALDGWIRDGWRGVLRAVLWVSEGFFNRKKPLNQ